jgi:DNA-binding MarR family transcriptional regulator
LRDPELDVAPADSQHHWGLVYQLLSQAFIELDDGDRRFLRLLTSILPGVTDDYTLTIPHFWALVHLGEPGGRTMAELATLLICDKSNVTPIVDKLEQLAWAERVRGKAGDRRYTQVVLTELGHRVRQRVTSAHDIWVKRRLSVMNRAQLDQLAELLKVLQSGLRILPEQVIAEIAASEPNENLRSAIAGEKSL